MGLINLVTNLSDFYYYQAKGYVGGRGNFSAKKLPYGDDRAQGGSSKQPYIQTPIPENSGGFGVLDTDFILRGGSRAVTDSVKDVERLGKYFLDVRNPSGLLFVAKQNLLSRTAVRTQSSGILNEGVYTPLSTLAEAGGVAFGLHVNKQGLNPFNGPGSLRTYSDVVTQFQSNNTNRLITIYKEKQLPLAPTFTGEVVNVLTYPGGPNSILGIGSTHIRFADQRTGDAPGHYLKTWLVGLPNGNGAVGSNTDRTDITVTADNLFINYKKFLGASTKYPIPASNDEEMKTLNPNNLTFEGVVTFDQSDIINIPTNTISISGSTLTQKGATTVTGDFRNTFNYANGSVSPNYTTRNIEQRVLLGNPGDRSGKNLTSYVNGAGKGAASLSSYDKINALPLYSDTQPHSEKANDLAKFRIGVIDNEDPTKKTYIHFRAFLNQISDQYTSDWNATKYIGRGENFYTYAGFDRKVSLSWTVAAQSKAELIPMYKKLNYLASICAPDYSGHGYMRGNIVTLTIGGYFYEQPGIITGLSYEMNDDNATWEIGIPDVESTGSFFDPLVKELPHLIKVTGFNFIPIHTFVPRKQQMKYDPQEDILNDANGYGPERYIALANGGGENQNNYGKIFRNPVPIQPSTINKADSAPPTVPPANIIEFKPPTVETRNYDYPDPTKIVFKSDTIDSQNPLAGKDARYEAIAKKLAQQ